MMAVYFNGRDGAISEYTDHREGRTKASLILAICALATALDMIAHVAERWGH